MLWAEEKHLLDRVDLKLSHARCNARRNKHKQRVKKSTHLGLGGVGADSRGSESVVAGSDLLCNV